MNTADYPTELSVIAPPEPYGALIFDCDGTLVDTMPNHFKAWVQTLRSFGADFTEERFYQWGGMPTSTIVRSLNEEFGYGLDVDATHKAKEALYIQLLHTAKEIQAVTDIARANYGKVPMAVASGSTHDIVEMTLELINARHLFSVIATADNVAHGKPAPDVFLFAAEQLGVAPADCIVYEDGELGLEGARRAGMRAIDVRALWDGRPSPSARRS